MTRLRAAALVLVASVALAGCSATPTPAVPRPEASASVPPASGPTTPSPTGPTSAPAVTDELAKGSARHVLRSGGLTIDVEYSASLPLRWTSDGGTPLQVQVSVRNRGQKIYLTRTTMRFVVNDGSSSLPGPDPLVDTANLTPGYLVTGPYSYVQSFSVPPVDRTAKDLTIDVKLELVSLVDKKAKDYSKQTVTDELTTVVTL